MLRKYSFIITVIFPFLGFTQPIFNEFDEFLKEHVVFGLVDYQFLSNNQNKLEPLVNKIANYDLSTVSEAHKTAFYINTYNFLVINQVAKNYPITSPLDVDGFFKENSFQIAGEQLTLDQVEFEKLLERTKDSRIHFALGCAARGCPYLYEEAFFPETVNQQLEFRAKEIIEIPNYVYVDEANETVMFSKVFEWYMDQFLVQSETLIQYVNQYKRKKIPENYRIQFRNYDWNLNSR